MGIRTRFANAGPAVTASSTVAIRKLFMVAPSRAAIARPGGVGEGRFAEKGLRLARPQGRSCAAPYAPAIALVNRGTVVAVHARRCSSSPILRVVLRADPNQIGQRRSRVHPLTEK